MLLQYEQLKKLVEQGVITNVTPELINGTSIDVTLGNEIFVESGSRDSHIKIGDKLNGHKVHFDSFLLTPGEFILGHTQQIFYLPNNISAEYKLKSSLARIGINHLNAGWCDPGWSGSSLTLELKNMTQFHSIILKPGDRIGQVVFFEHQHVPEERSYSRVGRYNNDPSVTGAKPPK
jgi:dCTP deaminase